MTKRSDPAESAREGAQVRALRPVGAPRNNLPVQLTSFIGRGDEMTEVAGFLVHSRIVTLTGSGGCGKTRLALEVAARHLDRFPDGVWWIDLAPIGDPELVANAVANVLGVREVAFQTFIDTLKHNLGDKAVLLVLDNCEHVIESCAQVVDALLRGCPNVQVLATSREALGIEGETAWRLPSLAAPRPDGAETELLGRYDAVSLFVDRAVIARPNFRMTDENASAIAQICHRLDGIPLAIELAAARTRLMTPNEIATGLTDRFRLLTGGTRTAMPRQQTLLASVEWSYRLLSDKEQGLLRRLAVFAGGFTLDAAEEVCSDDLIARTEILDLLSSLVDKSLVQIEEHRAATRYRLLETIRQYANQKLTDSEEAVATRTSHLDFYVGTAEEARAGLDKGSEMMRWLETLDLEYENLRAAMEWARGVESDKGMAMTRHLQSYWFARGLLSEGSASAESAAAMDGNPAARSQALTTAATLAATRFDFARARELGLEALELARSAGDDATLGWALYAAAAAHFFTDADAARPLLAEAWELAERSGEGALYMRSLTGSGIAEVTAGDLPAARSLFEQSIELHRQADNGLTIGIPLLWLGQVAWLQGDLDEAEAAATESLELWTQIRMPVFVAHNLHQLAIVSAERGNYDAAAEFLQRSAAVVADHPDPLAAAALWFDQAYVDYLGGNLDSALERVDAALPFFSAAGTRWIIALVHHLRTQIALRRDDVDGARSYARQAADLARGSTNPFATACALKAEADSIAVDEPDRAEDLYHEALQAAVTVNAKFVMIDVLECLAMIATARDNYEHAARILGASARARERLDYARAPVEVPDHDACVTAARTSSGDEVSRSRGTKERACPWSRWSPTCPEGEGSAGARRQGGRV